MHYRDILLPRHSDFDSCAGSIIGTLATGAFAFGPLSATLEHPEGVYVGGLSPFGVQATATVATLAYSWSWGC
jgi:hypothetical protein